MAVLGDFKLKFVLFCADWQHLLLPINDDVVSEESHVLSKHNKLINKSVKRPGISYISRYGRGRRHLSLLSLGFPVVHTDFLLPSNVQCYLGYLDVILLC